MDHWRLIALSCGTTASRSCLLTLGLLLCGCVEGEPTPTTPPGVATPEAPSWSEQLAAVRAGSATSIATEQPVSQAEFLGLGKGCESLETLKVVLASDAETNSGQEFDWTLLAQLPKLTRIVIVGPVDDAALLQIAKSPALTALNLPTAICTDTGLAAVTQLTGITQLRFGSPHVTDNGVRAIGQMTQLKSLHLIGVPFTDAALESLAALPNLQSLYIDGGACTDAGLSALIKQRPALHLHIDQLHLPSDPQSHDHHSTDSSQTSQR